MEYEIINKFWECETFGLSKRRQFQAISKLKIELQDQKRNIITNPFKVLHTAESCPSEHIAIA